MDGSNAHVPAGEVGYRSGGSRGAQWLAYEAVRGRRVQASALVDEAVRFLDNALHAGIGRAFLIDTANALHDEVKNLVAKMRKDLDDEHLPIEAANVDVSELYQLITKLEMLP